ncbi:MAG: helix-turn-helix transcriptional regulator [Anaerolineae bacterium]|nr:helix-turn-helix transcriptional regulator [Anaerolineae bacterium]
MKRTTDPIENLVLELRRGTLVLSVLSQMDEPQYGYSLVQCLAEKGLDIDQGTLYPLLRRLEKQGLLDSEWSIEESRPRRYYVLNARGKSVLRAMVKEWRDLARIMNSLLQIEGGTLNGTR